LSISIENWDTEKVFGITKGFQEQLRRSLKPDTLEALTSITVNKFLITELGYPEILKEYNKNMGI